MVKDVAEKFGVDRMIISRLKKKAANLWEGKYAPKRKEGTGNPGKFSIAMLMSLKRLVTKRPFISARQIKMTCPRLEHVSIRSIQHVLLKTSTSIKKTSQEATANGEDEGEEVDVLQEPPPLDS